MLTLSVSLVAYAIASNTSRFYERQRFFVLNYGPTRAVYFCHANKELECSKLNKIIITVIHKALVIKLCYERSIISVSPTLLKVF